MTIQATRSVTAKGHAFAIEDHSAIADWASKNHYRVVVRLDHGIGEEEYEEAVEFYFGSRCFFLIWRDANGVVVQSLVGRPRHYGVVPEAPGSYGLPTMRMCQAPANRRQVEAGRALFPSWPGLRAIATSKCRDRRPGQALQNVHVLGTTAKSKACPMAGDVPVSSWPGLSGPPVAAQVLELMARTSRAMTMWERRWLKPRAAKPGPAAAWR